jgi:hypothetical protein
VACAPSILSTLLTPAIISRFRWLLVLPLAALAVFLVIDTLHWRLVGDATLMHYEAFLLDHGFAPYRQIVDVNLPGCFLLDWTVIHLFGPGALAWRIFDFALIAAAAAAMIAIARPYDWLGGLFAAVFFFTLHVHDGVDQAGERDLVLAVLLLIACAAIFSALRGSSARYSILFGFACGAATLIKPTALLWMAGILILAAIALRRRNHPLTPHLLAAFTSFLAPIALTLVFLAREHALHAFFAALTGLTAYHAHIDRFPLWFLVEHLVPSALYPVIVLWLVLVIANRSGRTFEGAALGFSVLVGIASFILQGKAFPYHRYPLEAFLFLPIGIDATVALRMTASHAGTPGAPSLRAHRGHAGWASLQPIAALALLLYPTLILAPSWLIRATHYDWQHDDFTQSLTADLTTLASQNPSGPSLSGQIQCLDMTAGCLGTLYNLRLVQSTGFLYDCYFFHQPQNAVTLASRDQFLSDLKNSPPRVIVLSNQNCLGEPLAWLRPDAWPQFSTWLAAHYSLNVERDPQRPIRWWPVAENPPGYRIYVRNP